MERTRRKDHARRAELHTSIQRTGADQAVQSGCERCSPAGGYSRKIKDQSKSMKISRFEVIAEFHPDFSWFVLPTIEIDVFERSIEFSWLCFSVTIMKLKK